jgi:hypothetical protein
MEWCLSIFQIHRVLNLSDMMKGKELYSLEPEIFCSKTLVPPDFLINTFRGKVKQLDIS